MNPCLSERQRELVELAGRLADQFARRAAEHDRDNTFPLENDDDLCAAGLLRLTVPAEPGGQGAGLAEVLPVLERLATGDGSTTLAVTMHISPLGQWATVWRRTGNPKLAELLGMAARDQLIWASVTGEPGPNGRAKQFVGAGALGVELSPVIGFAENGHESRARA